MLRTCDECYHVPRRGAKKTNMCCSGEYCCLRRFEFVTAVIKKVNRYTSSDNRPS